MRSKLAAVLLLGGLMASPARAEQSDGLLQAMREELTRSVSQLQMAGQARPYFIQYSVSDLVNHEFRARDGALLRSISTHTRPAVVEVRVGSYSEDALGEFTGDEQMVVEDDLTALRHYLWLSTDEAYREALQGLARKKIRPKPKASLGVNDFSPTPKVVRIEPVLSQTVDQAFWEDRVRKLSAVGTAFPAILRSRVSAGLAVSTRYLLNSEGTELRESEPLVKVSVVLEAEGPDGSPVTQAVTFSAREPKDLPDEAEMIRQTREACEQLLARLKAPTLSEEYLGPVLFVGTAAGNLFGEVLVPLMSPSSERLLKQVLPVAISVVDDPTLHKLGGLNLMGACSIDDEGVEVHRLTLIDRGKLVNLLSNRKPTKAAKGSNGRGRSAGIETGLTGVLPTNLVVTTTEGKSFAELKRLLLQRCREEGLSEGMIVRASGPPDARSGYGGVAPLYYRVSVETGKEELIQGVHRENLNLRGLRRLLALGNEAAVTNYVLLPNSFSIVSPSLLLGELQVTPNPDTNTERLLLPPPQRTPR